jgi:putative cell wall-binding protein
VVKKTDLLRGVALLAVIGALAGAAASPATSAPRVGPVRMVSMAAIGLAEGDADSDRPSVSADGRYVSFASAATNIVPTATGGHTQIYRRDLVDGSVDLISSVGGAAGSSDSSAPSISGDGSTIAYLTEAVNISPLASAFRQAVVWSEATGMTTTVSTSPGAVPAGANLSVDEVVISADATSVAFASAARNIVFFLEPKISSQVFRRSLATGVTELVSVDRTQPGYAGPADSSSIDITDDGAGVVFATEGRISSMDPAGKLQVYLVRPAVGTTELISVAATGGAGDALSMQPSVSADGSRVAFVTRATNLGVPTAGSGQVVVRDLLSGVTSLVSSNLNAARAGNEDSREPAISGDGGSVSFESSATNLVPGDSRSPHGQQVIEADLRTREIRLVSAPYDGSVVSTGAGYGSAVSGDGRIVAFASNAGDLVSDVPVTHAQVFVTDTAESPSVTRIGGADRYEVSQRVSTSVFPSGTTVGFVASGQTFADALSASAAAASLRSPVLLVGRDEIPSTVLGELRRLAAGESYAAGGPASVSQSILDELSTFSSPTRFGGADRYEVSAALSASRFGATTPVVYIASGEVFPDALSGSAAAGAAGGPVLLVTKNSVPTSVADELRRLTPGKVVILGGTNTVSQAVEDTLDADYAVTRIRGADRFVVSANVSASTYPVGPVSTVYVASGEVFPDAVSASAAAGVEHAPVLLVTKNAVPGVVAAEIDRLKPTHIVVVGGPNTISDEVLTELRSHLGP